jgi:hypothetical protein
MKSRGMAITLSIISSLLFAASVGRSQTACTESYGKGPNTFSLATGSPGELGLLKGLGDAFAKKHNTTLCWVKAGTGESMQLLKDKKVDMIMVHAPAAEKKAVEDGWAIKRELIGSTNSISSGRRRTRPGSRKPRPPPRPTRSSPTASPNFSPAATTPAPIRRKWRFGKKPISSLPAAGTS